MGVEVIWGHPVNRFSQSSDTYTRNIESLEPSVSSGLTYIRIKAPAFVPFLEITMVLTSII